LKVFLFLLILEKINQFHHFLNFSRNPVYPPIFLHAEAGADVGALALAALSDSILKAFFLGGRHAKGNGDDASACVLFFAARSWASAAAFCFIRHFFAPCKRSRLQLII
jgi:hypothetical protein